MEITLYRNFHKKMNSTKQPTNDPLDPGIYHVTGILKEPCSVMRPAVSLQNISALDNMHTLCTYCYIAQFHRYYFIEDWTWNDGLWVVSMAVDVLGSFKTEIGSHKEYILRTDSDTVFDGAITDTMYPTTTDFEIDDRAFISDNEFVDDIEDGCYIVGIISNESVSSVGAVTYYAMTPAEFGALKNVLLTDLSLEEMDIIDPSTQEIMIQDISTQLLKTLYNPYQYIASCMWFPFTSDDIPIKSAVTDIPLGWWVYHNLGAYQIEAQIVEFSESCELIAHPQAYDRGEYLNFAPYTKRMIIGRFGTVPIDTSYFKLGTTLQIFYMIDIVSGQCRANLMIPQEDTLNDTIQYTPIGERGFLIGVPIQLAQIGRDYLATLTSGVSTIGALADGFTTGFAGSISGIANGIYNTVKSSMPQVETSGQNGTFITPFVKTHLISHFFTIVDEDIDHMGRPVCKEMFINLLSGYILCSEGDIDISCYDDERKQISKYLVEGFFWE